MKRLLITIMLGVALLFGCATAPVVEKVPHSPFVIVNDMDCAAIEYQIGEWIDDNKNGVVDAGEWYVYVIDTLEPKSRKEYSLPNGYYIVYVYAEKHGEVVEGWVDGPIPAPGLEPHEKTTLFVGCSGHEVEA